MYNISSSSPSFHLLHPLFVLNIKSSLFILLVTNKLSEVVFCAHSHVPFGGVTLLGLDLFWGGQPGTRHWAA